MNRPSACGAVGSRGGGFKTGCTRNLFLATGPTNASNIFYLSCRLLPRESQQNRVTNNTNNCRQRLLIRIAVQR